MKGGYCPDYYLLGQHVAEETVWSPANRTKQKDLSKCPEPNSNKNKDLESGKVWRSDMLTTKA